MWRRCREAASGAGSLCWMVNQAPMTSGRRGFLSMQGPLATVPTPCLASTASCTYRHLGSHSFPHRHPQRASCSRKSLGGSSPFQGGYGVGCSQNKGWPVGNGIIFGRWPLDKRPRTRMLIRVLLLTPAELRDVLPLSGPQFAACKVGRSQYSRAGVRMSRQEVEGEGQGGPLPPGLGAVRLPGPHQAALSLTVHLDCSGLVDSPWESRCSHSLPAASGPLA